VSESAIGKYELGQRRPPAAYVYQLIVCLKLNDEEARKLIDACCADLSAAFVAEFNAVTEANA
ncbi:MAG TPA: hypothetical protein VND68_05425, partial [Chloroflexia bacterium]|nr:hypothetical protein [Chloroflexia bacterium]